MRQPAILNPMPLCFDLDGTLGSFTGGYVLLREALGDVWGEIPSEAELRSCKGSTDWEIVDELHRQKFGSPLPEEGYRAYDDACLARFEAAFHPERRQPVIHTGLVEGLTRLASMGHQVWLVSGNTPQILDFKARTLGVDPRVRQLGSLPGHTRSMLLRQALEAEPGPHLYVGDRGHDRDAAQDVGIPFLAVGDQAPGAHPVLPPDVPAEVVVATVRSLIET